MSRTLKDTPYRYQKENPDLVEYHYGCDKDTDSFLQGGRIIKTVLHPAEFSEPRWHHRVYWKDTLWSGVSTKYTEPEDTMTLEERRRASCWGTRVTRWEFGPQELKPPSKEVVLEKVPCDIDIPQGMCGRYFSQHRCSFKKGDKSLYWHRPARQASRQNLKEMKDEYNSGWDVDDENYIPPGLMACGVEDILTNLNRY